MVTPQRSSSLPSGLSPLPPGDTASRSLLPLCSALKGLLCLAEVQPSCLPARPLATLWKTGPRLLALPGAAARRHLTALTCEGAPGAPWPGCWSAWGCQQSALCSCAWLGGRSHASPPQRWWGWHRHVRAQQLQLEGWGAALELSSEPQWAGGSGGLGCLGGLGPKGNRPDLPQERASLVPGRSSVTTGLGVGGEGILGRAPVRTQVLVGRWRVTSLPPRLSRVSRGCWVSTWLWAVGPRELALDSPGRGSVPG